MPVATADRSHQSAWQRRAHVLKTEPACHRGIPPILDELRLARRIQTCPMRWPARVPFPKSGSQIRYHRLPWRLSKNSTFVHPAIHVLPLAAVTPATDVAQHALDTASIDRPERSSCCTPAAIPPRLRPASCSLLN